MNHIREALLLVQKAIAGSQSPSEVTTLQRAEAALKQCLQVDKEDGRDAVMRDPFRHRRTIGPEHLPGMVFE